MVYLEELHYIDLSSQDIVALGLLEDEGVKNLISCTLRGKEVDQEEISLAWANLTQKAKERLKIDLLDLPSAKDKAQALCLMVTKQMEPQKGPL